MRKKLFVLTMYAVAVATSMTAGNVCTVYKAEDIPALTETPNDEDASKGINRNKIIRNLFILLIRLFRYV